MTNKQIKTRTVDDRTYTIIDGELASIGNSTVNMNGTVFSVIQFEDGTTLRNVIADDIGNLVINPGKAGRFIFYKLGRENLILLGYRSHDGKTYCCDGAIFRKSARNLWGMGFSCVLLGIPFSLIIIGLPLVACGIWAFVTVLKLPTSQNRNEAAVRELIALA